jgi:hypothetical protein
LQKQTPVTAFPLPLFFRQDIKARQPVVAACLPHALQILLKFAAWLFVIATFTAGKIKANDLGCRESKKKKEQLMRKHCQAGDNNFLFSKKLLPLTGNKQQFLVASLSQGVMELQSSMWGKCVIGASCCTAQTTAALPCVEAKRIVTIAQRT